MKFSENKFGSLGTMAVFRNNFQKYLLKSRENQQRAIHMVGAKTFTDVLNIHEH